MATRYPVVAAPHQAAAVVVAELVVAPLQVAVEEARALLLAGVLTPRVAEPVVLPAAETMALPVAQAVQPPEAEGVQIKPKLPTAAAEATSSVCPQTQSLRCRRCLPHCAVRLADRDHLRGRCHY